MPDLLLELFSEEIPARMQAQAASDLARMVTEGLKSQGIDAHRAKPYATPRRLTVHVPGLPDRSPEVTDERKGPRVGAPEQAIQGFLKSAGLASIDQAEVQSDKRGDFYLARIAHEGRSTSEIVAELVPDIIRRFPWPKSMRWGAGRLRWIRPLHSVLCLLDDEIVRFEVDGIASGNQTRGHRFMSEEAFAVSGFDEYVRNLERAKVILDPEARRDRIKKKARELAIAEGGELIEDEALVAENAGLTEWPVPLCGQFSQAFLDVPPEVLSTAMKAHQKCFSMRNSGGSLMNRFVVVSNLESEDGGEAIVAGNERVIGARLSDARFFWDQDRLALLQDRVLKLQEIIFHEKLGTQYDRTKRIMGLTRELAPIVGADPDEAERAAILAKADLVTDMVGEFPELQGIMGRHYALDQGEMPEVADAIATHYKPLGPADDVPSEPVAMALALADKLDMLVGFWAIGEKPTGSKDPYALRRAALGVIRIVLENKLRLRLGDLLPGHLRRYQALRGSKFGCDFDSASFNLFFADRLKVYLRDGGARYDLIDAVFGLSEGDDLLSLVRRVEALGQFLGAEDGANLLIGIKRASNILRIEEKKDGAAYVDDPETDLFAEDEERTLSTAIEETLCKTRRAVEAEDFSAAMSALAGLRVPVDAFFDHVTVNAEDPALRANRLKLLNRIRAATREVADFSKIEG